MTYLLILLAVYWLFGAGLTYSMRSGMHRRRTPVRDWLLGPVAMPVLFLVGLIFMACEKLWARLLPLLDYEKPEEMRAGPLPPAPPDDPLSPKAG